MTTNTHRVLSNDEIACVSGADGTTTGVIAGPNGEGCTPDLEGLLRPPVNTGVPTVEDVLKSMNG